MWKIFQVWTNDSHSSHTDTHTHTHTHRHRHAQKLHSCTNRQTHSEKHMYTQSCAKRYNTTPLRSSSYMRHARNLHWNTQKHTFRDTHMYTDTLKCTLQATHPDRHSEMHTYTRRYAQVCNATQRHICSETPV